MTRHRKSIGRIVRIAPTGEAALRSLELGLRAGSVALSARSGRFLAILKAPQLDKCAKQLAVSGDYTTRATLMAAGFWGHGPLDPDLLSLDLENLNTALRAERQWDKPKRNAGREEGKALMAQFGIHHQHRAYARKFIKRIGRFSGEWSELPSIWRAKNRDQRIVRLWSRSSPATKLLYLHKATFDAVARYDVEACELEGDQLVSRPFTINLSSEVQEALLASRRGPISVVSKRMRESVAVVGSDVHYWVCLELSPGGNYHLHGCLVYRRRQFDGLKKALKKLGGKIAGGAGSFQIDFNEEIVRRWVPPLASSSCTVIRTESDFRTDRVTSAWARYAYKGHGRTIEGLSVKYPEKSRLRIFTANRSLNRHARELFSLDITLMSEFVDKVRRILRPTPGDETAASLVRMGGLDVGERIVPLVL